jgi:hypothetical protein
VTGTLLFTPEQAKLRVMRAVEKWRVRRQAGDLPDHTCTQSQGLVELAPLGCLGTNEAFAYSDLAAVRFGMSGSASFQSVKKS